MPHSTQLKLITLTGFILTGVCFYWYTLCAEMPVLLLALVTLGMSYDFLSHIVGSGEALSDRFLRGYARINYAALCFGIPFTAFAGTFVMARVSPEGLSAGLADFYIEILIGSLVFGALFVFACYRKVSINGASEFVLDKSHSYTNSIFIARRVLLAASLLPAIFVIIDGWSTDYRVWSILFTGAFISSIPLHILHKQVLSMLSEAITQALAMYATWYVFVA